VGKSTLLSQLAGHLGRAVIDCDDLATRAAVRDDPARFVESDQPVLIDEYQHVPSCWTPSNLVRLANKTCAWSATQPDARTHDLRQIHAFRICSAWTVAAAHARHLRDAAAGFDPM